MWNCKSSQLAQQHNTTVEHPYQTEDLPSHIITVKVNRFSLNQNQKNALDIKIRESIHAKVSTVKFLGVTLDEKLTFKDYVNSVTTKIYKSVGVMRRLHCQLPADVMVKLYYSLVYSHLTYALLPWGRSWSTNAAKIECAHRVARKITHRLQPIDPQFSLNLWLLCFFKSFQHKYP